jgi:hypothetical protein
VTVLSVDPGRHVGWALWNSSGRMLAHGTVEIEEFLGLLRRDYFQHPAVVVYEDFRLQRHRAERQSQSRMEASQVIGMLRLYAGVLDAELHAQELEARDLGYMHSGIKKPTDHDKSHDLDAVAHGFYYFETLGIEPVVVL